jgi:flagellar hook-associated protein 2
VQNIVSQLMTVEKQPLATSQTKLKTFNSKLSDIGQVSSALSGLQTAVSGLSSSKLSAHAEGQHSGPDRRHGGHQWHWRRRQLPAAWKSWPSRASWCLTPARTGKPSAAPAPRWTMCPMPSALTWVAAAPPCSCATRSAPRPATPALWQHHGHATPASVTLQDIADKINAANAGVNASIVQYKGNYSLVIAAAESGSDNAFSITAGGTDSSLTENSSNTLAGLQQSDTAISESNDATDASLTVNGVYVSSSNTVSDVIGGATVSLQKPAKPASP